MITHAPYWPTLTEQIKMADAAPVLVRTHADDGFAIHAQPIVDAITPRTRGIILNSPCNPTGALIAESELATIGEAAARHGIWVVVDLCYEKLIYDEVPHNLPGVLARTCRDLTILCGSASKAYSMTGWRCGLGRWSGECHRGRRRTAESFDVERHLDHAEGRRQRAHRLAGAGERDAGRISQPARPAARVAECGSAAALPQAGRRVLHVRRHQRRACRWTGSAPSIDFADALLEESRVALTPGEAFDAPGFIRISCATSIENLREGSRRLLDFVVAHAPRAAAAS